MVPKGMIALDIDGTITDENHAMASPIEEALKRLSQKGWLIVFVTGRSFSFGSLALRSASFDYYFCCYNGAFTCFMPGTKPVFSHNISWEALLPIVEVCRPFGVFPIVHRGIEDEDRVYYCPKDFSSEDLSYFEKRRAFSSEHWVSLETWKAYGDFDFPYAKVFGKREVLEKLAPKIKKELDLETCVIQDPLYTKRAIIIINHTGTNKGRALLDMQSLFPSTLPTIAAGDDLNDLPLLKVADVSIAVSKAPKALLEEADIVAAPETQGMVGALKRAVIHLSGN